MIVLMVLGAAAYFNLGQDEDPPFAFRVMVVRAYWPGATAQEVARRYATKKWGKNLVLEGNKLCRKEEPKKERLQTRCLP